MGELSLMAGAGGACLRGRDELRAAAGHAGWRLWCVRGLLADGLRRWVWVGARAGGEKAVVVRVVSFCGCSRW